MYILKWYFGITSLTVIKLDVSYIIITINLYNEIMCEMSQAFGDPLKVCEANPSSMTEKAHTFAKYSSKIFSNFSHYYINILNDGPF